MRIQHLNATRGIYRAKLEFYSKSIDIVYHGIGQWFLQSFEPSGRASPSLSGQPLPFSLSAVVHLEFVAHSPSKNLEKFPVGDSARMHCTAYDDRPCFVSRTAEPSHSTFSSLQLLAASGRLRSCLLGLGIVFFKVLQSEFETYLSSFRIFQVRCMIFNFRKWLI